MKSALIYYSHYGNTAFAASEFSEVLGKISEADIFELRYSGRQKNLLERFFYRVFPSWVELEPVPLDLKDYDLLCLGIPVWGGRPSAPVAKYLNLCKNIEGKKIVCFFVYSIDVSAKTCANYVKKILQKKGCLQIINLFIPWQNVHQKDFLDKLINEAFEKFGFAPPPT